VDDSGAGKHRAIAYRSCDDKSGCQKSINKTTLSDSSDSDELSILFFLSSVPPFVVVVVVVGVAVASLMGEITDDGGVLYQTSCSYESSNTSGYTSPSMNGTNGVDGMMI
jgi:hypothetical protein